MGNGPSGAAMGNGPSGAAIGEGEAECTRQPGASAIVMCAMGGFWATVLTRQPGIGTMACSAAFCAVWLTGTAMQRRRRSFS